MNLKALEIKCPVCGCKNLPRDITIDQGWQTRVTAKYECNGSIKRLFRRDRPCATRYKIEWNNQEAEQVIEKMKGGERA